MNEKYLPIGTVCSVNNKEIMIVGHSLLDFANNMKKKDYLGCAYPEGLLLPSQLMYFDHSEIEKIEFLGFSSQKHNDLSNLLKNGEATQNNNVNPAPATSQYVFDANGILISTGGQAEAAPVEANPAPATSQYVFDANGILISTGGQAEAAPVEANPAPATSQYVFDENGILISTGGQAEAAPVEANPAPATSQYVFDENGILISTGGQAEAAPVEANPAPATSQYVFDENGILISTGVQAEAAPAEAAANAE